MQLVIPAMELKNGMCWRQILGEPGTESFYAELSDSPMNLAKLWRVENSKSMMIIDRDSLEGRDITENVKAIELIKKSVDIPINLLANFASISECKKWLQNGIYRVVVTSLPLYDPEGICSLIDEFSSSRVAVAIRAINGVIPEGGGFTSMLDSEYAVYCKEIGIRRIVYSDIQWEGTYEGPDTVTLQRIAEKSGLSITASGGIDSPEELWNLRELERFGVDSVVIGRALFENKFPCQKIWRIIEAELKES